MVHRPLGNTGLIISPIGFGSFKIGRNEGIKYAQPYPLPSDEQSLALLDEVASLGINYIDTAPAYGMAEERVGRWLESSPWEIEVSTKVGERFVDGRSEYDFSSAAVEDSMHLSRCCLGRDVLDIVFIHSNGDDLGILRDGEAVNMLRYHREEGMIRAIGFSGKTVEGARKALEWADAIMVEFHLRDRSHEQVMAEAHDRGVGVVVKKGLASGRLDAAESIRFVLGNPHVTSLVIGGLNPEHLRRNVEVAATVSS
jgi:aryl-alcohol dehydrogenase-like predicted oxidoreductase